MAKNDVVVVAHRGAKGELVHREFSPETVDPKNPAHKGLSHVDLANQFVAKHASKGARIVEGLKEAPAPVEAEVPAQTPAPVIPGVEASAEAEPVAPAKAPRKPRAKK